MVSRCDDKIYDYGDELLLHHFRLSLGDIEVVASDGSLRIDSNILSLKSIYFQKMFKHDFAEKKEKRIHMSKYNLEVLNTFFSNIYYGIDYYEFDEIVLVRPSLKDKFVLLELFHIHLLETYFKRMVMIIKDDHVGDLGEIGQLCEIYGEIAGDIRKFCVERIVKIGRCRIRKEFVACFDDLIPGKSIRKVDDKGGYCCKHFKPLNTVEIGMKFPHLDKVYTVRKERGDQTIPTCIVVHDKNSVPKGGYYYYKDNCCEHGERADTSDFPKLLKDIPQTMRDEVMEELFGSKNE
ncbi:MAG: hypothetical protein Hyperionvirus5_102 [Hyperionvirus sp.]|uniref:BTB domain-containing protein n=1 Tax=Hyperionvirus sp. TaxID=2487770 RepID=A0A3G5A7R1_9VIRU|nr:MAG: hypothetical protein Hyperionvirus5_102 [Hyperionvirus sp.]